VPLLLRLVLNVWYLGLCVENVPESGSIDCWAGFGVQMRRLDSFPYHLDHMRRSCKDCLSES
jgi:hypothetical protein